MHRYTTHAVFLYEVSVSWTTPVAKDTREMRVTGMHPGGRGPDEVREGDK